MNNYKKILLATDFSSCSEAAAIRAAELAAFYSARLVLLHVISHYPEDVPNDWIGPEDAVPTEYLKDKSRAALIELSERLKAHGKSIDRDTIFSTQSAKRVITHYAKEHECDLIVIGSHGRHGVSSMPGSVANGVLHLAQCDVLVVRTGQ